MQLNLPQYNFRFKQSNGRKLIFDECRRKFVPLTPEEWVRQNFIQYLTTEKGFPKSLIAVEYTVVINRQNLRSDIVAFGSKGLPLLAVECKAPHIKLTQATFDQIARYNMQLNVCYLVVTNGMSHYCCKIDSSNNTYSFLSEIPSYSDLTEGANN